jgi:deoxycytidylate deaminase
MAELYRLPPSSTLDLRLKAVLAVAQKSLCLKARCGALIVREDIVPTKRTTNELGAGFNGPPQNDLTLRSCHDSHPSEKKPRADRTCCTHAEWRAILRASLSRGPAIIGSSLYFARSTAKGELLPSGKPYCTVCSRLALEAGIREWVLWHPDGPQIYSAKTYHQLSSNYDERS